MRDLDIVAYSHLLALDSGVSIPPPPLQITINARPTRLHYSHLDRGMNISTSSATNINLTPPLTQELDLVPFLNTLMTL